MSISATAQDIVVVMIACVVLIGLLLTFLVVSLKLVEKPMSESVHTQVDKLVAAEVEAEKRISAMVAGLNTQIDSLRAEVAKLNQQVQDLSAQLTTAVADSAQLQGVIDKLNGIAPDGSTPAPTPPPAQ